MKRFLCRALIVALLCALCLPAALAEEVGEAVEAAVAEAVDTGNDGLTVDGVEEAPAEAPAEEPAPVEAPAEEPAPAEDAPMEAVAPEPPADEDEQAVAAPEVAAPATGIQLSAASIAIGVKETYALTATALPAGSALPAVSWRSDNEKYAKVDANGVVTGVKRGAATVYAKIEGGEEVACKVDVLKAPRKLAVTPGKVTLGSDGATVQLAFAVPKGSASNSFTWSSSNPAVAVVDQNGVVTSVGSGKATVMVKAYNGKGGKCKVTVLAAPTAIAFPTAELSIATGQKLKLAPNVTYNGKKKADPGITYAISPNSRDAGCVTLNPTTGELSGARKGSCVITATTYNGKTATLPVTVAAAPTAISLSDQTLNLGATGTYTLQANLTIPAGETECASTLTWTTSNKKVATVDANGVVTAHKKGTSVITATTVTGLKAACKVIVYKAPGHISLSPANAALKVGETGQYKVTFPKGTGGAVTFTSSNPAVAAIDATGKVTALAIGDVTITATSFNGKTATSKLTVSSATGEVELPPTEYDSIEPTVTEYRDGMTNAEKLEYVIYCAMKQLGKPYVYGSGYKEDNPVGFDCSGLVYWSFKQCKIKVQDSAYKQGYDSSQKKISLSNLKRGDIVCFNTNSNDDDLSDHTGIYLGNGKFIHASTGDTKKVVISDLTSSYYTRTFSWGRRVLE